MYSAEEQLRDRNEARYAGTFAFLDGKIFSRSNISTDGQSLYSYGTHFPMARKIQPGCIAVNVERYSTTTSKHQSAVKHVLAINGYTQTDTVWYLDDYEGRIWTRNA